MRAVFKTIKLVLSAVFVLALITNSSARAQTINDGKLGLTVSPVIDEISQTDAQPGSLTERSIKITNPVHDTVTLYPVVLNFYTDNDKGQPKFYDLKERSSRYAISEWISFPKEFVRIAPNEVETFPYILKVPKDAEPGGHYGAVLFSTEPPKANQDTSQVSVVGLIGTLILATVPGDITQKLIIEDFNAPTLLFQPPANFSVTFNNMGNVHLKPYGSIKIRNMFGKAVEELKINDVNSNILPESKRTYTTAWNFDWKRLGKYTANASISFGSPEQQLTEIRTFYIIPIWLIVLIALLVLGFGLWRFKRRQKPKTYVNTTPPSLPPTRPRRVMG